MTDLPRVRLTHIQFAQRCAYIAKSAAGWAVESLNYSEEDVSAAQCENIFRFTDNMRQRLDEIDRLSGREAHEPAKKDPEPVSVWMVDEHLPAGYAVRYHFLHERDAREAAARSKNRCTIISCYPDSVAYEEVDRGKG